MRGVCVAAVFAVAVLGCGQGGGGSAEPMPTDGPNQVVIKVPGMT